MVKKVGKYEMFKTLGEGTFGKVKYAVNTETNEACAIKVLDKEQIQKLNMGNQIKKEISIMKMVRHKYIVGMKEVLASKTKIFIVLELVTGGELFDKIVSVGRFNEQNARFYFQQLVEGVEYCHSMGVCHRDLKPENLLVDEHGNLKISDFGLSSLYVGDAESGANRTEILHTTCGTPNYVAPEVLADAGYDGKKADAWSMGVILYVLLAGFLPFDETTITALFVKIQAAEYTFPSWFSTEVREFLSLVMTADPKARMSVSDMKSNVWVAMAATAEASSAPAAIPKNYADDGSVIWTQEQLEAAVESTMEDSTTASSAGYHQHDDDDDEDATAPRALNAFDLVSQCGGFALNRMFCPKTFSPVLTDQEEASIITKHMRSFEYSSSLPPAELFSNTITALNDMKFNVTKFDALFKFKSTLLTGKGMIGLSGQVFLISGTNNLCLLEFRRGKGDMMEFRSALEELVNKKLISFINKASSEEEAKSSSA